MTITHESRCACPCITFVGVCPLAERIHRTAPAHPSGPYKTGGTNQKHSNVQCRSDRIASHNFVNKLAACSASEPGRIHDHGKMQVGLSFFREA